MRPLNLKHAPQATRLPSPAWSSETPAGRRTQQRMQSANEDAIMVDGPPFISEHAMGGLFWAKPGQASCFEPNRLLIPHLINGRDCGHSLVPSVFASGEEVDLVRADSHSLHWFPPSKADQANARAIDLLPTSGIAAADPSEVLSESVPYQTQAIISAIRAAAQPYARSLTSSFTVAGDEMTTTISPPNSPPDLSGSKSSKSSSTHSSFHSSSPDGILSDVTNFEDIGLGDDRVVTAVDSNASDRYNIAKRPIARVVPINPRHSPPNLASKDFTGLRNPGYPSLHQQVRHAVNHGLPQTLNVPKNAGTLRRGFTSPSVPTLPTSTSSSVNGPRNRSASPKHRPATLVPSAAFNGSSIGLSPISPRSSLPPPSRRGSWQPSRKSIQELEAEYHDSDDELPDEASLWNVPMSPRPPSERPGSVRSSARGSPERDSPTLIPPPIPLSHTISAPSAPLRPESWSRSLPRTRPPPPRTSSLSASTFSASNPSSPKTRTSFRDMRAKSWTSAMAELSEEARVLNQVLEYHSDIADRKYEEDLQNGSKLSRPTFDTASRRSSKSHAVQLPPVQKGSLDFMPISKEKEAILSRTRPSWLPPKDPREEKKHLKEYQKMMAKSIEADKRREENVKIQKCQKDDTRESLNKLWEQHICPNWDSTVSERSTRELWWRGVSPRVRGQVWQRAVGNQLALTEKSYTLALQRARDIRSRQADELSEQETVVRAWFADIDRDADAAFPELNLFQSKGPMRQDLVDICQAYVCYRSDVGFVYGIQLMAALLLLQLDKPWEVFVCLANCLNRATPAGFLTCDASVTGRAYVQAADALQVKAPKMWRCLFLRDAEGGMGLSGEEVFEPMFRTLFTSGLDLERLVRVWDCWVFEGDRILARTAVAVLSCLEGQIVNTEGDAATRKRRAIEILGWGPLGRKEKSGYWNLEEAGDVDAFMKVVKSMGRKEKVDLEPNQV